MLHDLGNDVKFTNAKTKFTKEMVKGQLEILAQLHGRFYRKIEPIDNVATLSVNK